MEQKDTPPLLQSSLLLLETKKVCVIGTTLSFRTEPNRMEQRCNNGDGEGWPTKRWWNWFFISHSLGARQLMSYGGLTTEISLDDHELPACCYARGDKAIFFSFCEIPIFARRSNRFEPTVDLCKWKVLISGRTVVKSTRRRCVCEFRSFDKI